MLKARAGLIMTPERKYLIGIGDEATRRCRCEKGGLCNLAHILNGCNFYLSKYTQRHNNVARRIKESILRYRRKQVVNEEVHENKQIKLNSKETIQGREYNSAMRPDLWYWTERKVLEHYG
jgi:hypothetical protein